jgi:hypothetical protein
MACARVNSSSCEAIHPSIAASSATCQRSPTWMPLPVVAGRPRRFLVVTRIDFAIFKGTIKSSRAEGFSLPPGSNPNQRRPSMAEADRVHSTPPTNPPKIPPVDQARRHFLTVTAGGAAATLAIRPISCRAKSASPIVNKSLPRKWYPRLMERTGRPTFSAVR